jgi:hypothetical protein
VVLPAWAVAAPRPGEPLQLLIPTKNLVSGTHRLIVRAAGTGQLIGKNPELGSYSFVFERTRS